MVVRCFKAEHKFMHIPICSDKPKSGQYICVIADGKEQHELFIRIALPTETPDYYVPMNIARYGSSDVSLVCREENAPADLFDGIIEGGAISEHPELYPQLYEEDIRQRVHFSPARGWLNDPNGLFWHNGVFNVYYQHNPFANHHFWVNVSWGHAQSADGIHFCEYPEAIMPQSSKYLIASGSALVDVHNISGMGSDTVLAAYTDLYAQQYHGRPTIHSGCGQRMMYSVDGGMTFHYLCDTPIIPSPDDAWWRDPKLLQMDEKTLAIAVYETFEGQNCISIYKSTDCKKWDFCSRIFDFYECPDLFPLKVRNSEEIVWVVYGAKGKYLIGSFENYEFRVYTEGGFIDYGDSVYAGQTFNNYEDAEKRIYTAWLRDKETGWDYDPNEPNRRFGFSQSLALFSELSVVKDGAGYRLMRAPVASLEALRDRAESIIISQGVELQPPCETVFALKKDQDASVRIGTVGFDYNAATRTVITTSNQSYPLYTKDDLNVRIISDRRSVEIYLHDEIVMSFFVAQPEKLTVCCDYNIQGVQYLLKSIWEDSK